MYDRGYDKRLQIGFVFLLVLGVAAAYWIPGERSFIGWDDAYYTIHNYNLRKGLSAEGILWAIRNTYATYWMPVTWLSYLVEYSILGIDVGKSYLINCALHVFCSVAVFFAFSSVTKDKILSGVLALLFSLHPLRVEVVAWSAQRKDLLSSLFALVSLGLYGRYVFSRSRSAYFLSVAAHGLGALAKPMTVTLPVIMLVLSYWPLVDGDEPASDRLKRRLVGLLPFLAVSCAVGVVTLAVMAEAGNLAGLDAFAFGDRVAMASGSVVHYLKKTFLPWPLSPFYPIPEGGPDAAGAWFGFALFAGVSILSWRIRERHPYVLVGWAWFWIALLPVSGLVQSGYQAYADRFTYFPHIGLLMAVVWGADQVRRRWKGAAQALKWTAPLVILLLVMGSRTQASYWRSPEALFRHALAVTGPNWVAHERLSAALDQQGRHEEAISEIEAALSLQPEAPEVHFQYGTIHLNAGRPQEALPRLMAAAGLDPENPHIRNSLGVALVSMGQTDQAYREFIEAARLTPNFPDPRYNLAMIELDRGAYEEAERWLLETEMIAPDLPEVQIALGQLLGRQGRYSEALTRFRRSLELQPRNLDAVLGAAMALESLERDAEAMERYRRVLLDDPSNQDAHRGLERLQRRKGTGGPP